MPPARLRIIRCRTGFSSDRSLCHFHGYERRPVPILIDSGPNRWKHCSNKYPNAQHPGVFDTSSCQHHKEAARDDSHATKASHTAVTYAATVGNKSASRAPDGRCMIRGQLTAQNRNMPARLKANTVRQPACLPQPAHPQNTSVEHHLGVEVRTHRPQRERPATQLRTMTGLSVAPCATQFNCRASLPGKCPATHRPARSSALTQATEAAMAVVAEARTTTSMTCSHHFTP